VDENRIHLRPLFLPLPRMPVSMTIKPILIRELKAEAKREGRTVSNLVERIIEQHLAGQKPT